MKNMLLAAAAVLALGTASAQALPATSLGFNSIATQSTDAGVQQVHHWGYYGYYGYYNYYGYGYSCYRWSGYWGRYVYVC